MADRTAGGGTEIDIALAAAARWRARARSRNQKVRAVARGDYTQAEDSGRLRQRVVRLQTLIASRARTARPGAESVTAPVRPVPPPGEITDAFFERVIGETRDFLSIEYFERGLQASLCVGRILTDGSINGTGFLVAPDLVITNNHVLDTARTAGRSHLQLDYEANTFGAPKRPQRFALDPAAFYLTDKDHDFALVAVAARSEEDRRALTDYGYLPLIAAEGKITLGEPVNIVQHPDGRFKQIVIRESKLVDLPAVEDTERYFHYEADTEKGSSGSPVFNDQWEVVALHHSGVPRTNAKGQLVDKGGAVITRDDEDRMVWVANEGIRTSRLVQAITAGGLDGAMAARRDALLERWGADGAPDAAPPATRTAENAGGDDAQTARRPRTEALRPAIDRSGRPPGAASSAVAAAGAPPAGTLASLTLPLRIDISLGGPAAAAPGPATALLESVTPDPDDPEYLHRPGYDPGFLGFAVPLPTLVDERHGPLLTFGPARDGELRYHHFSVLMNARRRLAYVAAVNIDAGAAFHHDREAGSEHWSFDPRVPRRQQAGGAYYLSNPFDKGHLVRRDDAAWGDSAHAAKLANDDTFHWTNCSPQHAIFNQSGLATSHGLMLWGNLENAVSALAPGHGGRLCVLNGPIFADTDRPYRQDFFLPEAYWKLIVLRGEDGQPRALAFQLSQAAQLDTVAAERFAPDELRAFEVFQVPVSRLTERTRLDFGPIAGWDALGGSAGPAQEGFAGATVRVRDESAIRI